MNNPLCPLRANRSHCQLFLLPVCLSVCVRDALCVGEDSRPTWGFWPVRLVQCCHDGWHGYQNLAFRMGAVLSWLSRSMVTRLITERHPQSAYWNTPHVPSKHPSYQMPRSESVPTRSERMSKIRIRFWKCWEYLWPAFDHCYDDK